MSADFAYVIDCTGSMRKWIVQVKEDIKKVVTNIGTEFPHHKLRLGCVAYRDWSDGDKRLEKLDFTEDISVFETWVGKLKATGGDDAAEDVLGGLQHATTLTWSSPIRVLFHICDAPPHNKMYHNFTGVDDTWPDGYNGSSGGSPDPVDYHKIVLNQFNDKQILYVIAKLQDYCSKMVQVFQDYGKEIDLTIKERKLKDTVELLDTVEQILTDAITRVDVASIPTSYTSKLSKDIEIWNPFKPKQKAFEAFVGIDFGTDGTGFAYATSAGKVFWQQTHTTNAHIKDRTNILLRAKPPYKLIAFGQDATDQYSSKTDKTSLYFERFKMALYDKELSRKKTISSDAKYDDDMKDDMKNDKYISYLKAENGVEIPASIVFRRALEYIKKTTMELLKKALSIRKVMDVQWILTVPAIWSPYAKEIMKTAALQAGIKKKGIIDHLLIATEPECASVIARKTIKLDIGTKYILLDLGGGTADIACHQAVNDYTIEQIFPPQGGSWGSSYIDEAFFKLLDKIFTQDIMDKYKNQFPNNWVAIKENFRGAKSLYDGTEDIKVRLHNSLIKFIEKNIEKLDINDKDWEDVDDLLNDYEYNGNSDLISINGLALTLNKIVWNDLFNYVLIPLLDKTDEILSKPEMDGCSNILMVGGLSESSYVQSVIRDKYKLNFSIHTVTRPMLAVVEGAATIGLRPSSIASWIAPESIGLQIRRDYNDAIDNVSMKKWNRHTKKWVINCGFSALIKKGTRIDSSASPKIEWFRPWIKNGQNSVNIKLFASNNPNPIHTGGKHEGEILIALPDDWKDNEAFPIAYWDKGAEKILYVAVRNWPEHKREITIKWRDPLGSSSDPVADD